ncbi:pyridoxamine 5'-phosphate oxidase family protein [Kordia jejudonensis]|uniref:pyridoxamine 5'-phosphate oxidase family protein n=1 Tax=Kordia jejudonensis TaxID=1348245 RepID=UPI0006292FFC|nr:pyridoxamine 5'-phosphate oxidase family protein [Kordia jejudonensis]
MKQIDNHVQEYIESSVLCWLATANSKNFPNVSPKEMFLNIDTEHILIANIASPNSINNIVENHQVCVSFINIFIQKGYKIKGLASIIEVVDAEYAAILEVFHKKYGTGYPIKSFIKIAIKKIYPIIAPSYNFYPETADSVRIEGAMKTYNVAPISSKE